MPRLAVLGNGNRNAGKHASGVFAVPDDVNAATIVIQRNNWPSRGASSTSEILTFDDGANDGAIVCGLETEVVRGYLFFSLDGGTTWLYWGHIGMTGGDDFDEFGDLITENRHRIILPVGTNRLCKYFIEQTERLRLQVDIDVETIDLGETAGPDTHNSIAVQDSKGAYAYNSTSFSTSNLDCTSADYIAAFASWAQYGMGTGSNTMSALTFNGTGYDNSKYLDDGNTVYGELNGVEFVGMSQVSAALSVTFSDSATTNYLAGIAMSGVDQTTASDSAPAKSEKTSNATSSSHSITKGEDGDVRVAAGHFADASSTNVAVSSGATSRVLINDSGTGNYKHAFSAVTKADDATSAMQWTHGSMESSIRGWNVNMADEALTASGTPSITALTSTGVADRILTGDGTPSITALTSSGTGSVLAAPQITDVNTTESWTDGDTGLVITGSGFV